MKDKKAWWEKLFIIAAAVILVYVVFFSFGFYHLKNFVTADEHHWIHTRIPQYWKGITEQKWKLTRINDKPGVSLAIVSGIRFTFDTVPSYMRGEEIYDGLSIQKKQYVLFNYRLPILIFNALFGLYSLWIIKKITGNKWVAFWSFTLITLAPILVGISQIVNPDALLWTFSTAALLSYLALLKTQEKKFILLAGVFLGFSLLSKYTATIIMPFFFVANLIYYFLYADQWELEKMSPKKVIIKTSAAFFISIALALLVFTLLMPAVFFYPSYLIDYTIGYSIMGYIMGICAILQLLILGEAIFFKSKYFTPLFIKSEKYFSIVLRILYFLFFFIVALVLANWLSGQKIISLSHIPIDARRGNVFVQGTNLYEKIILELYPLVFSLVPVVLFSAPYLWFMAAWKKIKQSFLVSSLSFFILIFYAAVIFKGLLLNIRYSIIIYPIISILAAVGVNELFSKTKLQKVNKRLVSLVLILLSVLSLWLTKPFYFNYTNDLLPKKYSITSSWGYGGYEAAQFLNSLPDAKSTIVFSNYAGIKDFCDGVCTIAPGNKRNRDIRYYVMIHRRRYEDMRFSPNNASKANLYNGYKLLKESTPIWELAIDGRPENVIRIYKAEK
jgi:4-amino-4-deoxy-L-arabinose transferase-like glycosyltransferase